MRVGFTTIPHRAGYPPATVLTASGYAVPALALRRKLAVELVASLTDSLAGRLRGEAGLELPALTNVAVALAAADSLGWEAAFLRALPGPAFLARAHRPMGRSGLALAGMMDHVEGAEPRPRPTTCALQLENHAGAR